MHMVPEMTDYGLTGILLVFVIKEAFALLRSKSKDAISHTDLNRDLARIENVVNSINTQLSELRTDVAVLAKTIEKDK